MHDRMPLDRAGNGAAEYHLDSTFDAGAYAL